MSVIQQIDVAQHAAGAITSFVALKPGEAQEGDLLVLAVALDLTGADMTVPGFTRIGSRVEQTNGTPIQVSYFWAEEDGSGAPTVSWGGTSQTCSTMMYAFRGVKISEPIVDHAAAASTSSTKTLRGPSVTAVTESLLLMIGVNGNDDGVLVKTKPAEFVHGFNQSGGYFMAVKEGVSAGASGNQDAELESANWNIGALIALRPQPLPVNTKAPAIAGTLRVGQKVECSKGTWTNSPTAYAYRWQTSSDGSTGWVSIVGANSASYTLTRGDASRFLCCIVTATNSGGSVSASSAASARAQGAIRHVKVDDAIAREPRTLFIGKHLSDYELQEREGATTEVKDPAGSGQTVFKMTVLNTDVFPITPTENPRAQMLSPSIIEPGSITWERASIYLPGDFPDYFPNFCTIFSTAYGPPYNGPSPTAFKFTEGDLRWQRNEPNDFDIPWRMPIEKKRWITILVRRLHSEEGWMDLWIDGKRITFFDPAGYLPHNPNKEAATTRLHTATMDSSNNGGPNAAKIENYREVDMFESVTVYHKPLTLKAA